MIRSLFAVAIAGFSLLAIPASADTGKDLVTVCGRSASLCGSDFQSDQLVRAMKASACTPADSGKAEAAVVDYLGKHPRTARLEIEKSVTVAGRALWPCRK